MEARQVVSSFFAAATRGDKDAVKALLAPDVSWNDNGPPEMVGGGNFRTADDVIANIWGNISTARDLTVTPQWFASEGEKVIVLIDEHGTVPETGRYFEIHSIHVYTVRNDRIVHFINYFDAMPMLRAQYDVAFQKPGIAGVDGGRREVGDSPRLRAEPATLSNSDIRDMLGRHGFYCKSYPWNEEYANEAGGFRGDLVDNGDGTLSDRATRLMWQQGHAPDYATSGGAPEYIARLNRERFAGHSDWRLPTIEELASLMTRERLNDGLYLSPLFSNRMWFWSCDKGGAGAGRDWTGSQFAWAINFSYGTLFCLEEFNGQDLRAVRTIDDAAGRTRLDALAASTGGGIRLRSQPLDLTAGDLTALGEVIRKHNLFCKGYDWNREFSNDAGVSRNDYVNNGDGTILDRATGLMWQQAHRPAYGRWKDAQAYVAQLNREWFAGYADWRLPTIEECCTLFTPTRENDGLFISPLFTNRRWIWTADIKDAKTDMIWNANFLYGSVFWLDSGNGHDIRAVRTVVMR
jgi:ketosteroid isomerase-like protein